MQGAVANAENVLDITYFAWITSVLATYLLAPLIKKNVDKTLKTRSGDLVVRDPFGRQTKKNSFIHFG